MAFTREKLEIIKTALDMLYDTTRVPLKAEVLERMANMWRSRTVGFSKKIETIEECITELVQFKDDWQACGCVGQREGWSWCPCELWAMVERYKMDIAIFIIDNHSEATTYEDLIEINKLAHPMRYKDSNG